MPPRLKCDGPILLEFSCWPWVGYETPSIWLARLSWEGQIATKLLRAFQLTSECKTTLVKYLLTPIQLCFKEAMNFNHPSDWESPKSSLESVNHLSNLTCWKFAMMIFNCLPAPSLLREHNCLRLELANQNEKKMVNHISCIQNFIEQGLLEMLWTKRLLTRTGIKKSHNT